MIITLIFAILVTINMTIIFFQTNITVHLVNLMFSKEFFARDDVQNWLFSEGRYLIAEWYGCPLCAGTWIACVCMMIINLFCTIPVWLPIVFALSVPWIPYLIIRRIERNLL